ncbi:MAG: hypothetical protein KKA22_15340 [Gammaproteobacteria bacterium]|jgi:hypothetical protein|nr:hypothetical protein [Gammaproteobacteria bacterium]MBU1409510.1 hypothetical protein [Gammaproteobacteria bacterium]MBU1530692.1 hypothetical protein [Gammaproteobacteria bacterium]
MMANRLINKRSFSIITASLIGYFGLLFLVPHVIPSFGATIFLAMLTLTLPFTLAILGILITWGITAVVVSRFRKRPLGKKARLASMLAVSALLALTAVILAVRIIPDALPTGSYSSQFDRSVWLDPHSADSATNGISSRQKMLADVVSKLPGRSRTELEAILGPSLETWYFQSSGRDLIYFLGSQRDSLFPIDSEWLLIWVDENGLFQRYAIAND